MANYSTMYHVSCVVHGVWCMVATVDDGLVNLGTAIYLLSTTALQCIPYYIKSQNKTISY